MRVMNARSWSMTSTPAPTRCGRGAHALDHRQALGVAHARRRLVEQEVVRCQRGRPGQLEAALVAVVERARRPVGDVGQAGVASRTSGSTARAAGR